jgi:hypothetical protein
MSRIARSRTPWSGFGDRVLSQEHDPVKPIRLPRRIGIQTNDYSATLAVNRMRMAIPSAKANRPHPSPLPDERGPAHGRRE